MDNFLDAFLESIEEYIDSYYTEMETREEYAKRRFIKKYKYNPNNKTIIVDGKQIKLDMDTNSRIMDVAANPKNDDTVTTVRQTSAELLSKVPTIHLDKNFFKLKNDKRRDAILQHEVGHTKLHNVKSPDKELKTNKALLSYVNQSMNTLKTTLKAYGYNDNDIKDYINSSEIKQWKKDVAKKYLKNGMPDNKERAKLRESAIEKFKKFDKSKQPDHANTMEFEADRYAANKEGSSALKKGIRELYKFDRRKNTKNQPKEVRSTYNKMADVDYNARSKVLKSKDLLTDKEKRNYR